MKKLNKEALEEYKKERATQTAKERKTLSDRERYEIIRKRKQAIDSSICWPHGVTQGNEDVNLKLDKSDANFNACICISSLVFFALLFLAIWFFRELYDGFISCLKSWGLM
jgi:hypothetical protein